MLPALPLFYVAATLVASTTAAIAPFFRDGPPRLAQPAYVSNSTRTAAVEAAFQLSWDAYMAYAFPADSLDPVKKTGYNDRSVPSTSLLERREREREKHSANEFTEMVGGLPLSMRSLLLSLWATSPSSGKSSTTCRQ